eukprot:11773071-Alexandrium_andersonii.AAC.1
MSASLVGSEMCIRDRLPAVHQVLRSYPSSESSAPTFVAAVCQVATNRVLQQVIQGHAYLKTTGARRDALWP